jgi:hypothetical protein
MSAATNPPTPTLDEILTILENVESISAAFDTSGYSFPNAETAEYITLNFRFRRGAVGFKAAPFVFEYPRSLFPEIAKIIRKLYQEQSASMEAVYRERTKKSISDVMAFIEQEMKQDTNALGTLYTKMRREHFQDALKYLRELSRRRDDIEAKQVYETERRAREAIDEEIARREKAAREKADREGQEAKRRKWAEDEERERKRRTGQTSDSGYARGSKEERMWNAFREAGGFEKFNEERAKSNFDDLFSRAFYGGDYANQQRYNYQSHSGKGSGETRTPPPPVDGKRRWYEVLGCAPGATRDQIRAAARQAAKGLHPDKNKNSADGEKFKEITEAKAEGLAGI